MSWTNIADRDDYYETFCGCGHSFFAHDNSQASNPMWHLGPCQRCRCRKYTTLEEWLRSLLKEIDDAYDRISQVQIARVEL